MHFLSLRFQDFRSNQNETHDMYCWHYHSFDFQLILIHFQVTRRALELINPDKTLPLHVSLDIDVLDPSEAPATGTPGNNEIVNSK